MKSRLKNRAIQWLLLSLSLLWLTAGCDLLTGSGIPEDPDTQPAVLLQWFRSGGIAGFCDELTVTPDGFARISSCKDPSLAALGDLPVPENTMVMLTSAANNLESFSDVVSDDAAADAMTISLVFNGTGFGEPEDTDREGLLAVAQNLYTQLTQAAAEGCTVTAEAEITIYQRPALEAGVFGALANGESVQAVVQSPDGWLGFDPGVAQAANVGVFRLRWIAPFAAAAQSGGCDMLPIAPALSATACYTMAMSDVMVRSMPEEGAEMLANLPVDGYALVSAINMADWLYVDLSDSSQPQPLTGWVSPMEANLNGPCDTLEIMEAPAP